LVTEISPLAQNENSKKERTTYRKLSNEVLRAVMFGQNIYSNYFLMKTAQSTNRIFSLERFVSLNSPQ
jgi:hypothetical protein